MQANRKERARYMLIQECKPPEKAFQIRAEKQKARTPLVEMFRDESKQSKTARSVAVKAKKHMRCEDNPVGQ